MARQIDLNPATHLTIGTVGLPGNRTFFLQGGRGSQSISLTIEKEQALLLASSLESFLEELNRKHPLDPREGNDPVWMDMRLREPVDGLFRVGNIGLGYNESGNQVVIIAYELVDEGEEPNVVSFWVTRAQIQSLVKHAFDSVKAGRPICGNCGRPIDAEGHFCPNRNGHRH